MAGQVQIDLDQLIAFIGALKSFNSKLSGDWGTLKGRWQGLADTWRDPECYKFLDAGGWQGVINSMEQYLNSADQYVRHLEQKAEPLKQYRGY